MKWFVYVGAVEGWHDVVEAETPQQAADSIDTLERVAVFPLNALAHRANVTPNDSWPDEDGPEFFAQGTVWP